MDSFWSRQSTSFRRPYLNIAGLSLVFTSAASSTSASYAATVTGFAGLTVELFNGGVSQGNMTESSPGVYELDVTLGSLSNDLTVGVGGTEYASRTVAFNAIVNPSFRGRFYNEGLTDISGNAVSVQNGSTAGADTNDTSAGANGERTTDGDVYIKLTPSPAATSVAITFYLGTALDKATNHNAIFGTSNGDWIHFGPITGILTDEIITVLTGGSRAAWTSASDSLAIGWHTLIVCWDGSKHNFYVDGTLKATTTAGTPQRALASSGSAYIFAAEVSSSIGVFMISGNRCAEVVAWASNQGASAADIYATLKLEHAAAGITLP